MTNFFERDDDELLELALNADKRAAAIETYSRQRRVYLTFGAITVVLFLFSLAFQIFGPSGQAEPFLIGAAILLVVWMLQLDQKIKLLKVISKIKS